MNVRMTRGMCRELQIRCLFFIQPLLVTKASLSSLEARVLDAMDEAQVRFVRDFYANAAQELHAEPSFHDLSGVLDEHAESHFFDLGHTSPFSGMVISKAIARRILEDRELASKSTGLSPE